MSKPRLLDLFCGAGGAAMGYSRAGFDVVGVDINPQPRYPFEFIQGDALTFPLDAFDAIHASPPCQGYSIMLNLPWHRHREYPLLIEPTRERLIESGLPWIIENVMGAQKKAAMKAGWLCGNMFGLPFYRHRVFQTNWPWFQPAHPRHTVVVFPRKERVVYGGTVKGLGDNLSGLSIDGAMQRNGSLSVWTGNGASAEGIGLGHAKGWQLAADAMGIDWMKREELTQAIPPAYTEYIGRRLMEVL